MHTHKLPIQPVLNNLSLLTTDNSPTPKINDIVSHSKGCFTHFHTNTPQSPYWLQWDAQYPPPKCPFTWGNHQFQLPASSFDPADPPTQTAYKSNQPFFHNAPDRQSKWATDRQMIQGKTCTNTCLRSINDSNRANNRSTNLSTTDFTCKILHIP